MAADRSARPEPPLLGQERQGEELLFQHLHSLRFFLQLPAGPGLQAVTFAKQMPNGKQNLGLSPPATLLQEGQSPEAVPTVKLT